MAYTFLYVSILVVWVIFFICIYFKPLDFRNVVVGIASVGYSIVFDTILGNRFGLYHYINAQESLSYILLVGIFLYPVLNMIYTLFLPQKINAVLIYTTVWIVAMLLFEYITILFGSLVFTGWRPFPWSPLTYVFTYALVYMLYHFTRIKTYSLQQ